MTSLAAEHGTRGTRHLKRYAQTLSEHTHRTPVCPAGQVREQRCKNDYLDLAVMAGHYLDAVK